MGPGAARIRPAGTSPPRRSPTPPASSPACSLRSRRSDCASRRAKGLRRSPPLPLGGRGAKREGAIPKCLAERKAHLDALAVAILVLCCFLWGLNQVAAKAALPEIPALWQATLRSAGAAILVWLWAGRRGIALFERDGTLAGGLLAGALFAAEFFCIFVGLQFTTASRMVVFIYIAPFVVALGMPLIARSERLAPLQSVGLVVAFAGVAWAFAEGFSRPAAGPLQWLGDGLGVLAGVLWGATTLAIRATALGQASAEKTLFYQLAVSALLLLVAALLERRAVPDRAVVARLGIARVPDGDRQLRQLPGVVLADPPLPGDAAGVVHHADAGVRPRPRRGSARRAGDRAPADRARDRRRRHLSRQPPDAMTRILATIALRLAVCAAISWAVWRWFGLSSMVPTLASSASCWRGRCSTSRARCATA